MRSTPVVSGLPALVFAALAGTMAMMAFVAVIGPVVRLLGLSEWHAGLSVTAAGMLWMLSARRWGVLSDRIGRRRVLLIALAAYALIYIALAVFVDTALQSPPAVWVSVLALVGLRALVGLFYAAVPPTAAALVADEAAPGQRAGAMAKLGTANAVGMVIGPMLGTLLYRAAPSAPYLLVGGVLVVLAVTASLHGRSAR
jgi:DHA1 family tetracycline resistance protein-like MFS transporter